MLSLAADVTPLRMIVIVDDIPSDSVDIFNTWGNGVGVEVWKFKDCWCSYIVVCEVIDVYTLLFLFS